MTISHRAIDYYFPEVLARRLIRRITPSSGIVLMYHEVLPDDVRLPSWTVVRESAFRWQMAYLQSHFEVVSLDRALRRVQGRETGSRPFAVVTFDDGYKGGFHTVLPIMKAMRLPFTVYVATQGVIEQRLYWYDRVISVLAATSGERFVLRFTDRNETYRVPRFGARRRWRAMQSVLSRLKEMRPDERERFAEEVSQRFGQGQAALTMMSEEEVRQLSECALVTIECHTHGHELLDQLDGEAIKRTIQLANRHIARITGRLPRHFAYPNGNFSNTVLDVMSCFGFQTAVSADVGIWTSSTLRMQIPRIGIGRFDGKGTFKAKVSQAI